MNKEEIDYWLKVFSDNKYAFMSKDGKVIPIYKAFEELKELHNKIDKAIEYLKNEGYGYDCCGELCYFLDEHNQKELLEILKGDVDE